MTAPENPLVRYSDAARRMSDAVALALTADGFDAVGKYMAFRLDNGAPTDRVLYPTRRDALSFNANSLARLCYVCITPDGMSPKAAEAFLSFHRQLDNAGYRMPHPDDNAPEIIMPGRIEEWKLHRLARPRMPRHPRPLT
jgi:hypothetical protein